MPLGRNHVNSHQSNSDANRDIRNIECRPIFDHDPVAEDSMDNGVHRSNPIRSILDEVDHTGPHNPVHKVAQGTPQDQRQAPFERPLVLVQLAVERHDEKDREQAHNHEKRSAN